MIKITCDLCGKIIEIKDLGGDSFRDKEDKCQRLFIDISENSEYKKRFGEMYFTCGEKCIKEMEKMTKKVVGLAGDRFKELVRVKKEK